MIDEKELKAWIARLETAPDVVDGDSDFMQAVSSRAPEQAWAIVDELMDALKVTNARMYDNVMRKMRG